MTNSEIGRILAITLFLTRIFIFTILSLLAAGMLSIAYQTTNTRGHKIEVFLIFLFALGVAGSGIDGFFTHFFILDIVAESVG